MWSWNALAEALGKVAPVDTLRPLLGCQDLVRLTMSSCGDPGLYIARVSFIRKALARERHSHGGGRIFLKLKHWIFCEFRLLFLKLLYVPDQSL